MKLFGNSGKRSRSRKSLALIISLALIVCLAVGGTVAFIVANTGSVENTFTPSHVTCAVTEQFNGTTKSNVNVQNTGDTDAYLRVALVTYYVNADGDRIGKTATIPSFTPGDGWFKVGDYYYYNASVAPNASPANALISSITLVDGQVIEVMAEAIQATPAAAVKSAWGVTVGADGIISKGA